jgi:serine/threonine protein kinase
VVGGWIDGDATAAAAAAPAEAAAADGCDVEQQQGAMSGLSAECVVDILIQVASGMRELHESDPPIYHRDLKASNILIRELKQQQQQQQQQQQPASGQHGDMRVSCMITDFGVSTSAASLTCRTISTHSRGRSALGTPAWSSPEHLLGKSKHDEGWSGDVWSFGVLAWELLTGDVPWGGMEPMQVCFALVRGERLHIPSNKNTPDELHKLVSVCWHETPSARPSFTEISKTLLQLRGKLAWAENSNHQHTAMYYE